MRTCSLLLVLVSLSLLFTSPALADTRRDYIEDKLDYWVDFADDLDFRIVEAGTDTIRDNTTIRLTLNPGTYHAYAEGGRNIEDLDMEVFDEDGWSMDYDNMSDNYPIVEFTLDYRQEVEFELSVWSYDDWDESGYFCFVLAVEDSYSDHNRDRWGYDDHWDNGRDDHWRDDHRDDDRWSDDHWNDDRWDDDHDWYRDRNDRMYDHYWEDDDWNWDNRRDWRSDWWDYDRGRRDDDWYHWDSIDGYGHHNNWDYHGDYWHDDDYWDDWHNQWDDWWYDYDNDWYGYDGWCRRDDSWSEYDRRNYVEDRLYGLTDFAYSRRLYPVMDDLDTIRSDRNYSITLNEGYYVIFAAGGPWIEDLDLHVYGYYNDLIAEDIEIDADPSVWVYLPERMTIDIEVDVWQFDGNHYSDYFCILVCEGEHRRNRWRDW